jgi:competence protein ComEC
LAAGLLSALLFNAVPPHWLLLACGVLAALCLPVRSLRPLAALLLGCAWSLWHYQLRLDDRLPAERAGQVLTVRGTITSIPQQYDDHASFRFAPDLARGRDALPRRVLMRWYREWPQLAAGQRWEIEARFKPPWGSVNFQGPDREKWLFAEGIGAVATVRGGQALPATGPAMPDARLAALRERVMREITDSVAEPRRRGIVQALAVADRSGMSRDDRRLLQLTGTSHLLAISGLHIGLAATGGMLLLRGLGWLLPVVGTGRMLRSLVIGGGLLTALAYAALSGFGVPTVRALAMLLAVMAAALSSRAVHPARPWLLALCAVLLIDPLAPLGAGFWFSFLAVAALLTLFVPRGAPRSALRTLLMAQAAVMLALLPVSAAAFQSFSLVGFVANLVAIPLVSLVVVPLVLAGVVAFATGSLLAAGLGLDLSMGAGLDALSWSAAGAAAAVLLAFLERVAAWQGELTALSAPGGLKILLALAGAFLLLLPRGLAGRWSAIFLLLPLFLPSNRDPPADAVEIEVLDAGQGTALLLRTAGRRLLYDSGPGDGGENNVVGSVIAPALKRTGGGPPDRIMISHGDLDHAGGLQSLARLYPGAQVSANLRAPPPGLAACTTELNWRWGATRFEVLHPSPALPYLGNDSSCVLAVSAPGGRVLLAGDVSAVVERRLTQADGDPFDVVLVPHHGSTTSSSLPFVASVQARAAVATAGLGNRFGFPKLPVRQRYEAAGARFWATGDCGALRLTLFPDGRLEARSARRERKAAWRWPVGAGCPGEAAEP